MTRSSTFICRGSENDVANIYANEGLRASSMEWSSSVVITIFISSISIIANSSCYLASKPDWFLFSYGASNMNGEPGKLV